jgi:hypothetical protein
MSVSSMTRFPAVVGDQVGGGGAGAVVLRRRGGRREFGRPGAALPVAGAEGVAAVGPGGDAGLVRGPRPAGDLDPDGGPALRGPALRAPGLTGGEPVLVGVGGAAGAVQGALAAAALGLGTGDRRPLLRAGLNPRGQHGVVGRIEGVRVGHHTEVGDIPVDAAPAAELGRGGAAGAGGG